MSDRHLRDPEGVMAHEDDGQTWSTTKEALLDKLARKRGNPLFQIDLFTIISLAQHRLGSIYLDTSERQQMQELAEGAVTMPEVRSDALRDYLRAMSWQLKAPEFSPVSVIEVLYRIKHVARRGWLRRKLAVSETVGAHSFGAVLLASTLLPEDAAAGGYSKETIIRMLVAHDLAESITGDLLPDEDLPVARDREAQAYRLLAGSATHDGVEGLSDFQRLFTEFSAEAEENAKIARDFDRLDNLMQLMLFRDHFTTVETYQEFYEDLFNKIKTPEGQRCRDLVANYFSNRERFSGWLRDLDAWAAERS